jgi:O-antigen/teichoic acid export membrane protein
MMHLIPNGRDTLYVVSVTVGALLNLLGNFILIPLWDAEGACIATIISALFALALQIFATRREISYGKWLLRLFPYVIYGFVMMLAIGAIDKLSLYSVTRLLLEISVGGIIFVILSLIHMVFIEKDQFVISKIKNVINRLKNQ